MLFRTIAITLLVSAIGSATEQVCLKNGFCLQADAHTQSGQTYRFQVGSGQIELQSRDIASLETNPSPPVLAPVSRHQAKDSQTLLSEAAAAQGLDPDFVRSVARIESALKQDALSKKGALGLMQLMPSTAKLLGVNPNLAPENALGGAKYLRALLLKYNNNSALALAAYNAGPGAVQHYGGVPPYSETLQYVRRVTREYDKLHKAKQNVNAKRAGTESDRVPGLRDRTLQALR